MSFLVTVGTSSRDSAHERPLAPPRDCATIREALWFVDRNTATWRAALDDDESGFCAWVWDSNGRAVRLVNTDKNSIGPGEVYTQRDLSVMNKNKED